MFNKALHRPLIQNSQKATFLNFRFKRKIIFELNPCNDKVGRVTKRNTHIAASTREKAD